MVLNVKGKDELLVMGIEKIRAEKQADGRSPKEGETGSVTTYKLSKKFLQKSINNVAEIMSKVRVKPYFNKGRPEGFRITRIKNGSILKTMGFKDGTS